MADSILRVNILGDQTPGSVSPSNGQSFTNLPLEILFAIFDNLDKPGLLVLGLSDPHYLNLLGTYFKHAEVADELDMYLGDSDILEIISINTTKLQPAIIRFICSNWERRRSSPSEERELLSGSKTMKKWVVHRYAAMRNPGEYDYSEDREDLKTRIIIAGWLRSKFDIIGGLDICYRCQKWILIRGSDGNSTTYSEWLANFPLWFRLCLPCFTMNDILRRSVLARLPVVEYSDEFTFKDI